jgi:hypothetical protein
MTLLILLSSMLTFTKLADTTNHSSVELQAIASDVGATPFFLSRLQYGAVPLDNPGIVAIVRNGKIYNLKKKYDWKYQVQATGWAGKQNDFWLTEAYVSGRRGNWELWAGRRKEVYGLGDTAMTSGFYAWSGNAVPMPKIQLGTRDYVNFAKEWLGIHMTYSHGWFDNKGPTINGYLHQKSLYGRIGKPESFINLFGGLNHQVSWGGEAKSKTGGKYDYYPSSLTTYFYVITLLKNRNLVPVDSLTTDDDSNNQYGNHLGSIDLAVTFNTKWAKIFIYKQTAYETGRVFSLVTFNDGNNGLSVQFKNKRLIQHFNLEYFYTSNQGQYISGIAKLLGMRDPHLNERENYFNNGRGSWNYLGRGIGSPLIILNSEIKGNSDYKFSLNAIKAIYLGIKGNVLNDIDYRLRIIYSLHGYTSNYGENYVVSNANYLNQISAGIEFNKKVKNNIFAKFEFGFDNSQLLKNTLGISLGVKFIIL